LKGANTVPRAFSRHKQNAILSDTGRLTVRNRPLCARFRGDLWQIIDPFRRPSGADCVPGRRVHRLPNPAGLFTAQRPRSDRRACAPV